MHDGSKLALLFPLEIMCFSDLLSSRKNRGWPEPDQRWESFTAWCIAQVSLSKPLLASVVLSHGSQERAQHTLLTLVLRRQIFRADADQRTTEDRSGTLHVCTPHICIWLGEPFPSRADVLHPASLPAHILEKQITGTFPSFLSLVSSIIPSTYTGKQVGHSLAQKHFLFPLLPGHNKGGSETRRILECCFAVCQIIKTKSHQDSVQQNGLFKSLVI